MSNKLPVVRAVDVGFGNTKYTTANFDQGFGCGIFPSLAPHTPKQTKVKDQFLTSGDVIEVEVNGTFYTVGKDARTAATTSTVRLLSEDYPMQDVYTALVKGALYQIRQEKIDVLVLGLPMNNYSLYKEALAKRMRGIHEIPNPTRTPTSPFGPAVVNVRVEEVVVVPQPLGAFLNYSVPSGLNEKLQDALNLVIDIGRGTLDWFLSEGNQPIVSRSGAVFGGTSKVALAVADARDAKIKENLSLMDKIEASLYTKKEVYIKGEPVNIFEAYEKAITAAINPAVAAMMAGIGNPDDIQTIMVTGGGASLYLPALQAAFGDREIIIDESPVFSNVRGFQLAGEAWVDPKYAAAAA